MLVPPLLVPPLLVPPLFVPFEGFVFSPPSPPLSPPPLSSASLPVRLLTSCLVFDVNEVKTSLIRSRRIIFTPDVDLKDELAKTSVQITCYDRNGEEVKRVTSSDPGTVEDNDSGDNGTTGGGSTDNGGGGDNDPENGDF